MLRLRTLGGLSLSQTDDSAAGIALSRLRLALIARVAAGGEQGVSRVGLLFQFWPDSDEERGRRALNQIAYSVRRELGEEELLLGTTELRLNSTIVTSDVGDFLTAVARGDHERVVALYGGAFLEDFFLREAPEFERWVEEERARLSASYARSLDTLAGAALSRGDRADESRWLERLAHVDQLNSRVALRLMESLAAAGDRAGALRFAQAHEALVRSELEAAPDPAIVALAAKLRKAETPLSETSAAAPTWAMSSPVLEPGDVFAEPPLRVSPSVPAPAARHARERSRWPLAFGGLAGVVAIAVITLALRSPRTLHMGEGGHRDWIVVTDVVNATGDAGFDRAVSLELTAGLEQSPRVTALPVSRIRGAMKRMRRGAADTLLDAQTGREIARREGARIVVVPEIGRADSSFVLTARIIDAGTGAALATELARAPDKAHIIDAIDNLASALRRDFGESSRSVTQDGAPLPQATTSSLDALEKYADGQAAFREGHFKESEELLKSAIAIDSDFAMAHVALGQLYYWYTNHRPDGDAHFTRALALLNRLPAAEQLIVRADIAGSRGDRTSAIDLLSAYLRRYPNDPNAMFQLAYNYMRAHQYAPARVEFTRLATIDSLNYGVWIDLALIDRNQNDLRGALAASARAFALDSDAETRDNLNNEYGGIYVSLGLYDSAAAVFRKMLTGSPAQRADGYQSLAFLDSHLGKFALAVLHLDSAIVMDRANADTANEGRHRLFMAELEMEGGATVASREDMAKFMTIFRSSYLEPTLLLWAGRTAARRGDRLLLGELRDTLARRARKESQTDQAALADVDGEVARLAGREREARASFTLALTLDPTAYEREEAAYGAFVDKDWATADRLYRAVGDDHSCCYEGNELLAEAPYWSGRVAEARGDRAMAVAEYDTLLARWGGADSAIVVLRDARARREKLARQ
jgi:DNA-binding SARP family transcriptional activator/tetratricopeptide (TPR) repeat protein